MKSLVACLMGLMIFIQADATQQPTVSGHVRLSGGLPVAGAQVMLFDLSDLRRGAVVQATTDEAGQFALPLAALGGAFARLDGFVLGANYPNPFNPSTIIPYELAATSQVRLDVFNALGQRIVKLVDGAQGAGAYSAQWDGTDEAGRAVGAGIYIYRLTVDGAQQTGRMVLIDGQAGVPMRGASVEALPMAEGPSSAYGLVVSGPGVSTYVDSDFGVEVGMEPVQVEVEAQNNARMKLARVQSGRLGDVNEDGRVNEDDALLVTAYIINPSTSVPNISLGDVDADGDIDWNDVIYIMIYTVDPSDSRLPPGIGEDIDGGGGDHGDNRGTATRVSPNSQTSGRITAGDYDYFQVTVSSSGTLTAHTTGSMDTRGRLENSSGTVLVENDDGRGSYGTNFRISRSVSSGTYYIRVRGFNSSTTGDYTLHVSFTGDSGGGVDLELESAWVSDSTPSPRATITMTARVRNVGNAASSRTAIAFFRSDDRTLGSNYNRLPDLESVSSIDPGSYRDVSTSFSVPSSGRHYYIACISADDQESNHANNCSDGSKAVEVIIGGGGDDHGDNRGTATRVSPNSQTSGRITAGDYDYFQVTVSSSGTLTAHTTGSMDTRGRLENSSGTVLVENDDGRGSYGTNFRISRSVSSGTYYIRVRGFNSSTTGDYTLHVSFTGDSGGGVDLELESAWVSDSTPSPRATITMTARVRNVGNAASSRTAIAFFRSDDRTLGSNYNRLPDLESVSSIDPGSYRDVSTSFSVPSSGRHYYIACISADDQESNHANNCSDGSKAVEVIIGGGGDDHGNRPSEATRISLNSTTRGTISPTGDTDWFEANVSNAGMLTVYTTGNTDTEGGLNENGTPVVVESTSGGSGRNFRFGVSVTAGSTLHIWVGEQGDNNTGDYTLHVSFEEGGGGTTPTSFDLDSDNNHPTGITYRNNRLYVVDDTDFKVFVYTSSGQRVAGSDFDLDSNVSANGITYGNNQFYVVGEDSGDEKVFVYTSSGQRVAGSDFDLDSANAHPNGITYGNNLFYVVDHRDDKVYVYTSSGQRVAGSDFDLDSANTYPAGITYANNRLYVVDDPNGEGKVFVYTSSGQRVAGSDFDLDSTNNIIPVGITYANLRFYVVDFDGEKIYVY